MRALFSALFVLAACSGSNPHYAPSAIGDLPLADTIPAADAVPTDAHRNDALAADAVTEAADATPDVARGADASTTPDASSPCDGGGVCAPGQQRTIKCGNCGTQTDTCTASCQWSAGACQGAGVCMPGATQAGICDKCSQQTCGNNCQWGACALKPGNTCEYLNAKGSRPCTKSCAPPQGETCNRPPIQTCQSNCRWAASCQCGVVGGVGPRPCL